MTKTFFKNQIKKVSGQKQRGDIDSRSIKEDLEITQTHPTTLNLSQKGKTQGIHECLQKIHVYTRLFQENPRVHATVKAKPVYRKKK